MGFCQTYSSAGSRRGSTINVDMVRVSVMLIGVVLDIPLKIVRGGCQKNYHTISAMTGI